MRNRYVCLMIMNFLLIGLRSQNFDWAKAEGLWAYDYGYGITRDNDGNIYVAGKYEENANFSGTILSCRGNHDVFVAKYTADGNLVWITTAGGVLGDYATSIECDGNYLYVAGEMEGYNVPFYFDNSSITYNNVGDNDIFVAKYDLNGSILWAKHAGAYQSDKALGVAYDKNGNVYIAGLFSDTCVFDGGHTIYGNGGKDIFLAKYDANGNFQWVRNAGSDERDEAKAVKCDADGNIYITGMFSKSVTFGSVTLESPNGYFDMFLVKYDPNGNVLWAKRAGSDYDEVGWGLAIDNSGKIYVAGEFNAYAIFDQYALTTTGEADIFVASYDQNGNTLWATRAGSDWIDRARGIGTDGNFVFITGQYGDVGDFGSTTLYAADTNDVFIAALNNEGNFTWAAAVGGIPDSLEDLSYESGNAVTADPAGYVYATGAILTGGTFGGINLEGYKRSDVFLTRISHLGAGAQENSLKNKLRIYPNPSTGDLVIDLRNGFTQKTELMVYNYAGQLIEKKKNLSPVSLLDLSSYEKGIYFVEIKCGDLVCREKIVLQ